MDHAAVRTRAEGPLVVAAIQMNALPSSEEIQSYPGSGGGNCRSGAPGCSAVTRMERAQLVDSVLLPTTGEARRK